jgi:hypothetical protein
MRTPPNSPRSLSIGLNDSNNYKKQIESIQNKVRLDFDSQYQLTGLEMEWQVLEAAADTGRHTPRSLEVKRTEIIYKLENTFAYARKSINGISDVADMFESKTYICSSFPVIVSGSLAVVRLSEIQEKTIIYCPRHEMTSLGTHSPSAFVGFQKSGRRFIYCSKCSAQGGKLFEEVDELDPNDLSCLSDHIEQIDKDYLTYEDFLPERGTDIKTPFTVIVKSPMGSGKTTAIEDLRKNHSDEFMNTFRMKNVMKQPSFLAICPRVLISAYTADKCNIPHYNDVLQITSKERKTPNLSRYEMGSLALSNEKNLSI